MPVKNYARQHQCFANKGNNFNCPAYDNRESYGFHWRRASNIPTICMAKRPGSTSANNVEKCQDKYDRAGFREHLRIKEKCIYHRLSQSVEEMKQGLAIFYGTRVILYLKSNNTSYQEMHSVICRQAGTIPNLLMVGGNSNLEYRKWATFYLDRGRADLLARACPGYIFYFYGNQYSW